MTRMHKIGAALAVPAVAGAVVVAGAGCASAATPISGDGYAGVILDHHETVIAGQVNAGNLINAAFGDRWTVDLPDDSIWNTGGWTPVTGDQFVDEAAAHPGGRVGIYLIDPAINLGNIFYGVSAW
ncbi:hypothetical protein RQCS_60830 (plasmid) [Rhodococcus qingshengii]|uniref:hypothetical protein n=1 Tax=Rhodococcus qingshengii TaxID=334542 RepID=UPI0007E58AA6|nr:hypothetical protein [Rhodococcus qingshengii]BCF86538.1 hypothetical protein RQCS_60830 [Rhodococcus qingshengii]